MNFRASVFNREDGKNGIGQAVSNKKTRKIYKNEVVPRLSQMKDRSKLGHSSGLMDVGINMATNPIRGFSLEGVISVSFQGLQKNGFVKPHEHDCKEIFVYTHGNIWDFKTGKRIHRGEHKKIRGILPENMEFMGVRNDLDGRIFVAIRDKHDQKVHVFLGVKKDYHEEHSAKTDELHGALWLSVKLKKGGKLGDIADTSWK